jgi:hypothetical protein
MKFDEPKCPECGDPPRGTIERLQGVAELFPEDAENTFEYSGTTDVWWDEQRSVRDRQGRVNLVCHDGHEWFSKVIDGDEVGPDPDPDQDYRAAAMKLWHREGEIEIDASAVVSRGDDEGAYVQAWVWVPDYEIPGQTPAEKKLRQEKEGD